MDRQRLQEFGDEQIGGWFRGCVADDSGYSQGYYRHVASELDALQDWPRHGQ